MSTAMQTSSDNQVQLTVEALAEKHLTPPPGKPLPFSSINIVIGPNGAGKTRFLNVIKGVYATAEKYDILYGSFPDLSPNGRNISSDDLPDFSLEEFMENGDVGFNDFFKEIESQHSAFLTDLLSPRSKKKEQDYEQFLIAVSETFSAFTGKTISKRGLSTTPKLVVKDPLHRGALPLEQALKEFSPGERMLFYMSLFLALRKDPLKSRKQVVILDEPEAHLHPDALIRFVKGLEKKFPEAQIWIATHSLFLLPLYKFENIIYLENSQIISRSSKLYEKILSSMLGTYGKDIKDFFASLPWWQYCEFIEECFTNPEVIDIPDPMDPQVQIFIQAMREKKLRKVLDYGGGSGRLGRSVEAASSREWGNLDYHIFDKVKSDKVGEGIKVFDKLEDTDSDYDCVVMMNVLHEVEPENWRKTFIDLYPRINPNGCLLFVEVEALSSGEYPNNEGYFLLGPKELKVLFNLSGDLTEFSIETGSKRHRGYLIPRRELNMVDEQFVEDAIRALERRTLSAIKVIRAQGKDQTNSRKYAFLLQQHMNAMLYLEKRSKVSPTQATTAPSRRRIPAM